MPVSLESDHPVVAWLSARDFAQARKLRGFALWVNWREFLDERDALVLGLGYAGVSARRQFVPFAAFERWVRLTGAPADLVGLDEFAAHWRWRQDNPFHPVSGRLREDGPARAGAQSVPIRAELFQGWQAAFARLNLFAPPSLDDYARHTVACCIAPCRRREPLSSS